MPLDHPLDPQQLIEKTFVAAAVYRRSLGSTSDLALQMARQATVTPPLLVVTELQTAGRGRGTNRWWSGHGALTFSLVLDVPAEANDQVARVALAAGLAVMQAVREHATTAAIGLKWPNDVYAGDRKLCGILVELPPTTPRRLVLGVGVNVNNQLARAPEAVRRQATSLLRELGAPVDRQELLVDLLQQLERQLERLWGGDPQLAAEWQRACILRGRMVELDTYGGTVTGYCEGIDDEGGLVLRGPGGPCRYVGGVVRCFA